MRPTMIVIVVPRFDGCARLGQAQEYMLVQALVAQTAIARFNERILHWLAGRDIVPVQPPDRLAQHRHAGQLAVIADDHFWASAFGHQTLQFAHHARATDEVSTTVARHSRLKSSPTQKMRKRRPSLSASDTKSSDQRRLIVSGNASGARVPSARLRRPRRRTIGFSSRYIR